MGTNPRIFCPSWLCDRTKVLHNATSVKTFNGTKFKREEWGGRRGSFYAASLQNLHQKELWIDWPWYAEMEQTQRRISGIDWKHVL